jgi:hypothetical protein
MAAARAIAVAVAAVIAGGCATTTVEAPPRLAGAPLPVRNADFEADPIPRRDCPPSWGCRMHNDPSSFRFSVATEAGSRGRFLKVTRVKREPWAMATQVVQAAGLKGKRVRMSVAVNAEGLEGGAGSMIIVQGASGRVLGHRQSLLERGPGWRRTSAEIDVPEGAEILEIGLLVEGGGWAGFDDVEVAVLPSAGR